MNKCENHSSQTGTPLDEETAQIIDAETRFFRERGVIQSAPTKNP